MNSSQFKMNISGSKIGVAIIGCGLIGQKRAKALADTQLIACADVVLNKAQSLAKNFTDVVVTEDWRVAVHHPAVNAVIVATTNNVLAEITLGAARAGKHVLVEKPAARRSVELDAVIAAASQTRVQVRVGFNHRYHPALRKAHEIFESGALGEMMFVRGRYGHGGRIGYENEWRANPALSGGGELIDQGVHLIDLARWFLGDFAHVGGFAHTYFWKMPVDDNGFMLLRTAKQQQRFACERTQWKNSFRLRFTGARRAYRRISVEVMVWSDSVLQNVAADVPRQLSGNIRWRIFRGK